MSIFLLKVTIPSFSSNSSSTWTESRASISGILFSLSKRSLFSPFILMATALFGLILRLEACHRGLIGALQRSKDDLVGQIDQKSQLSISDNVISMIQDEIQESINNFAGHKIWLIIKKTNV